jgi:hypothetical protein
MDIRSYIAAVVDALILRDPVEIVLVLLVLLAAPLVLLWTRSIALGVMTLASTAILLPTVFGAIQQPITALWLAGVWLALNCLHIAAVMHHRNLLMSQDLLERLTEVDYRINTFLDALDRRAALGADALDTKAKPRVRDSSGRNIHESIS